MQRDPERAVALLREAADLSDVDALVALASLYESGQGVESDVAEAERILRLAAAKRHPRACFELRRLHLAGFVKADDAKQFGQWLLEAAQADVVEAQLLVAQEYFEGRRSRA